MKKSSAVGGLGFACAQHVDQLTAARALLPRDRDVLDRRRDKRRTQLAGHRWAGEQESPLARGAAAERLIERAKAWAERHHDPVSGPGRAQPTGTA